MLRRKFLSSTVSTGAGLLILPSARTAFGYEANERFNLAVVGIHGYGAYQGFATAIHTYDKVGYTLSCDVDLRKVQPVYDFWKERAAQWSRSDKEEERKAAADHYSRLAATPPPLYSDFRRMLDVESRNIDAVVIATPDHTHASIAAAALRAGKPVFSEKPLTISAHEARALHQLAKETGLATQMNNHGAASPGFRRGIEIIREGLIGEVRQVHIFFSRGGRNFLSLPDGKFPVPPELDWNLWLAQVPWRDYHPNWINRIGWRGTSLGEMGNFAPHSANMAFMALNITDLWNDGDHTIRIRSECPAASQISYPLWERVHWDIPARGDLPPVTFTWHHGHPPDYAPGSRESLGRILLDHGAREDELKSLLPDAGCLILGSKGLLATTSHNTTVKLLPDSKFADVEQARPQTFAPSIGHYKEWVEAARGGPVKPWSHFEYAAPFAEFISVGSLSTRFPDQEIEFQPSTGKILNHPSAAEHLAYEYRTGWNL
jgi:hypothetical protein